MEEAIVGLLCDGDLALRGEGVDRSRYVVRKDGLERMERIGPAAGVGTGPREVKAHPGPSTRMTEKG